MITAFKPVLRVKQESGMLTVTKLFARNCVTLQEELGVLEERCDIGENGMGMAVGLRRRS